MIRKCVEPIKQEQKEKSISVRRAARVRRVVRNRTSLMDFPARRCIGRCGKMFLPIHRFNCICPNCAQRDDVNAKEYRVVVRFSE